MFPTRKEERHDGPPRRRSRGRTTRATRSPRPSRWRAGALAGSEGGVSAGVLDTLWVVAALLVAAACLWYVRAGLREGDAVLVVGGILAAAGFTLAGLVYLWLVW